jgi:ribosome recycling factor
LPSVASVQRHNEEYKQEQGDPMTPDEVLFDAEERMEKAVTVFRDELRGLRTGRATPALVENIRVEYYGSPTPLKQMATISTPDPQQILIRPFDQGVLKDIEKALRSSDLGMSPNSDGKNIRLNVPPMSGEQRQKMVARIKKSAEEAKVAIRNIRRDANKHLDTAEKNKETTEDERDKGKEDVQVLTKKFEDRAQELCDKKSKEIMEQ